VLQFPSTIANQRMISGARLPARLSQLQAVLAGRQDAPRHNTRCQCDKSAKYNRVMQEKMKWDPNTPYEYDFGRGLYYHHILDDQLLCGSQPTNADDVHYLKNAEKVDVIVSVRPLSCNCFLQNP
jgi:hypothetical protein